MKWFYLAAILLLSVLWCKANEELLQNITNNAELYEDVYAQIKAEFEVKCREQGSKDGLKNITKVFDDLKRCMEQELPDNADAIRDSCEEPSQHICTHGRVKVRECFKDFIDVWEDCSEPKEKYLPHFVFDAVEAFLDLFCADDGAFGTKIMNSFDCIFTLLEYENLVYVCYDQINIPKDIPLKDIKLTKEELCEVLTTANTCYENFIQEQCPDSEFKDVVFGLYNAVSSGCDKRHRRSLPFSFRLF